MFCQTISKAAFHNYFGEDGLSQSTILDIAQTPDKLIWLATEDGLNKFDGTTFINYNKIENGKDDIFINDLSALEVDNDGNLWFADRSNGIHYYDNSEFRCKKYLTSAEIDNKTINSFIITKDNTLWIATENGILINNINDSVIYNIGFLGDFAVTKIKEIGQNKLAVFFKDLGLAIINSKNLEIEKIIHQNMYTNNKRNLLVTSFYID